MLAFLDEREGSLIRTYPVSLYMGLGPEIMITTDASPWGLAGVLSVDGVIIELFECAVSLLDVEIFGHEIGSANGQQTWEALAQLIGLRIWKQKWHQRTTLLTVRSDSVGTLTLLLKLKATGKGPNIIAREIALDLGDACFKPSCFLHTPGVANVASDFLSRLHQPNAKVSDWPLYLIGVPHAHVPIRCKSFYKSLR
jgi:hypothetical protein